MDSKNPFGGDVQAGENQGEGNKTADAQYRKGVEEHLRKGNVEQEARQAERDVEQNPEEYERAAEAGKQRSAGELESDKRWKPQK